MKQNVLSSGKIQPCSYHTSAIFWLKASSNESWSVVYVCKDKPTLNYYREPSLYENRCLSEAGKIVTKFLFWFRIILFSFRIESLLQKAKKVKLVQTHLPSH